MFILFIYLFMFWISNNFFQLKKNNLIQLVIDWFRKQYSLNFEANLIIAFSDRRVIGFSRWRHVSKSWPLKVTSVLTYMEPTRNEIIVCQIYEITILGLRIVHYSKCGPHCGTYLQPYDETDSQLFDPLLRFFLFLSW